MKNENKKYSRNSGYNLLQMAIALIVVGFFVSAFSQWYLIKKENDQSKKNYDRVNLAMSSLQEFRKVNGHYPCPASLDATRTDPEYGHETNCEVDTSAMVGACGDVALLFNNSEAGRVCIQEAQNVNSGVSEKPRVRIGTLPFREMKLEESATIDAYGNRLIYAMTERQGQVGSYNENVTGITLEDKDGNLISGKDPSLPLIKRQDSVSHLVFSVGKDGRGGISSEGQGSYPCIGINASAGDPDDTENCDTENAAIFKFSLQYLANGTDHFDDEIAFYSDLSLPVWKRGDFDPSGTNDHSNDIFDLTEDVTGNIGIGVGESEDPSNFAAIDIQSTWSSGNPTSPYGDIRAAGPNGDGQGNIHTNLLCDSYGNNCFDPALFVGVAGDKDGDSVDDGTCPTGQVAVGISEGRFICQSNINVSCALGYVLKSIKSDGTLDCVLAPAKNCTAGDWLELDCTGHYFVAQADYQTGAIHSPGYAYKKSSAVACDNGVLKKSGASGTCTCTDSSYDSHPSCNSCDYLSEPEKSLCKKKAALSGTYTVTVNQICDTQPKSYKPKWTAAKPTTTGDINTLKSSYALVFDANTMTGDVPNGNVTHLATWPTPGTTYTGGSGSWTTNCTTCNEGAVDGQLRTVVTGTCSSPLTGSKTKEQRFNAALCEWQDTGVSTDCSCDRTAYEEAALCDDHYVRGTVTNTDHVPLFASKDDSYGKVRSIGVNGSCNYYDAGIVANYCECNVGYIQSYQANPTCTDGYEMSKKETWEKTLQSCPDVWENDHMVETGECIPVNYTYKEDTPKQNPADQGVLNGISRILGNTCPYTEASSGDTYICKKDKATFTCYCGK